MIRLSLHDGSACLPVAMSLLVCSASCQRVADRTNATNAPAESSAVNVVARQTHIERLPDEPDDLSQDLPAEVIELLNEHFLGYTLPLDEPPPKPEPASTPDTYSPQYVNIGGKPLAEAIYNNEIERARQLVKTGRYNIDVYRGCNMLHLAAQRGQAEICGLLLDAGLSVHREDAQEHSPKRTPLQFAIQSGSVETAKLLLARGAELTPADSGTKSGSPRTPLVSLAIRSGKPDMLKFLIDQGKDTDDIGLLVQAIREVQDPERRRQFAKLLLSTEVEWKLQDGEQDPFVAAVHTGDLELLRFLESKLPFKYAEPHLRAAVRSHHVDLCRYLVSHGARAHANPQVGQELMRFALVDYRSPELVDLIAKAGEAKKYCLQSEKCTSYCNRNDFAHPLYHAVMENDLSFCRYLIREFSSDPGLWAALKYEPYEYESDIEFFQQGNTILFSAVFEDNAEALQLMLKYTQRRGRKPVVDINAQNWCGNTVLHEAVNYGAARCVQLLLATGADPTIARLDGCTPLHIAMQHHLIPHHHSNIEMVEQASQIFPLLVCATMARGNEGWIHAKDKNEDTILHRHARAGYPANCRKLIELGADVNARNKRGQTPLHNAIFGTSEYLEFDERERHVETCLVLLDNGTDLSQEGVPEHQRYARCAAARNLYQVFDAIRNKGGNPGLPQNAGHLLCSAARFGQQDRVEQLLDWGADINARDSEESTALHQAARIKHLELCKFLIAHRADVNARDKRGQTPLFELFERWAIYPANIQSAEKRQQAFPVLQLLLENGADVSAKTNSTTSTSFSGTVLEVFKHMPKEFRDEIEKQ